MKWQLKLLRLLLNCIAISYVFFYVYKNFYAIMMELSKVSLFGVLIATVSLALGVIPGALAWALLATDRAPELRLSYATLVYTLSGFGKYTPGGALAFAIQTDFLARFGLKLADLLVIFAITALISITAGGLVGVVTLVNVIGLTPFIVSLVIMLLMAGLGYAQMHKMLWLRNTRFRALLDKFPSFKLLIQCYALLILAWVVAGCHLPLLANAANFDLTLLQAVMLISAFGLSNIAGIVFAALPGAIGVRDGTLGLLLSFVLTTHQVAVIVVLSRALTLFMDLFASGVSFLLIKLVEKFRNVQN